MKLQDTKVFCDSVKIDKFETLLYQKDLQKPIRHFGSNLLLERKNRYLKFQMKSNLEIAGKTSNSDWDLFIPKNNNIDETIFDIKLSNFNLAPLRVYLKHYLPKDLQELRGTINIYANKNELITEFKKCAVLMNDGARSMVFPEKLTVQSRFLINSHFISFDDVLINSENIHCGLRGKIYNYFGKSMPTVDLNIRIDKSKVADIVRLLPGFKVEEIDFYKLKKNKLTSDLMGNFNIKGRLPEPYLNGDLYLSNIVLNKPIPNTNYGANVKISLKDKMAYFDAFVPAGNAENVTVEGKQEIYNIKYAELRVLSTENVNLKSAQEVLNPLHEILDFIIGPVPIMDINGLGNIDIFVKGNRKNPHIRGLLNVKDAAICLLDMPSMMLKNADAKIIFDDQNVVFNLVKGELNNKEFKANGSFNLFGKFDFDINSKEQPSFELYNAILASQYLKDITKMLPQIDKVDGTSDFNLKIYGNVKKIADIKVNENVFAKGTVTTTNNDVLIQGIPIKNFNSQLTINGLDINADIKATVDNEPLNLKAKILKDFADINLNIPKFNPNFLLENYTKFSGKYFPLISLNAKYKGNIEKIQYNKIYLNAKILKPLSDNVLKLNSGSILLSNNKLNISNLKGYIGEASNNVDLNLNVTNAFSKDYLANGIIKIKAPEIRILNDVLLLDFLPVQFKNFIKDYRFESGNIDLDIKLINNKINLSTEVTDILLTYLPLDLPIKIINGNISIRNNILKFNKINLLADNMPILLDGDIRDIWNKQNFNIYINSKPQQEFIDKYINKNQIYPIKIKGDIVCWARLKGVIDNFNLKSNIKLNKDSSIYHFGATIGDVENAISVYLDSNVINQYEFKIKEFSYEKIIDSLNGKKTELNMLKARGGIQFIKDEFIFNDLFIKTSHPTDARIFNIIFRKPNIKQGYFISDLKINGKTSNPKIIGDLKISETDIPFLDMRVKNIELSFKDKIITLYAKGDILGSDFNFSGVLKNKLTTPYYIEKGSLYTKKLDLNRVSEKLKTYEVDNQQYFESFEDFQLDSLIINNFNLRADDIWLRNIHAKAFEALINMSDKGLFDVKDFSFNIAQGVVDGKFNYNLKNSDMLLDLNVDNINANDITWALFDLNDQIYGDMTGKVDLSCVGTNFESCMQSLNGTTTFNVANGRMPKLGSLEYLLRASNLIKGGFTGITMNGIIDVVSPAKSGEFSDIYGAIRIKDGIARNIEITSKGKSLSLFIVGTYNFATSIADMQVFGLLSRKLSTLLGPLGNLSLNTLFNIIPGVDLSKDSSILEKINKIPGIELSSKAYRKFIADIKGDINGEDYVTSFQWIN